MGGSMSYLSNGDFFEQLEACIARYGINGGVDAFARLESERTWTAFKPYSKVEPPAKADGSVSLPNSAEGRSLRVYPDRTAA